MVKTPVVAPCNNLLPYNAVHKCGLYHHAVSVHPSVTFMYYVKTAKDMAIVAIECEWILWAYLRFQMVPFSMTFSDL